MYYAMQFGYCSLYYVGVLKYHFVLQMLRGCYWCVYLLFPHTWHPRWLMGAMCTNYHKTVILTWRERPRIDVRGPSSFHKLILQPFPLTFSRFVETKESLDEPSQVPRSIPGVRSSPNCVINFQESPLQASSNFLKLATTCWDWQVTAGFYSTFLFSCDAGGLTPPSHVVWAWWCRADAASGQERVTIYLLRMNPVGDGKCAGNNRAECLVAMWWCGAGSSQTWWW